MISRHASTPSLFGIMTSITTTSGDNAEAALTASSRSLACPTTSNSPDCSSITRRSSLMIEWSSARRTLGRRGSDCSLCLLSVAGQLDHAGHPRPSGRPPPFHDEAAAQPPGTRPHVCEPVAPFSVVVAVFTGLVAVKQGFWQQGLAAMSVTAVLEFTR